MLNIVERIEKLIIRALIILLLAMVLGTIELCRVTILQKNQIVKVNTKTDRRN